MTTQRKYDAVNRACAGATTVPKRMGAEHMEQCKACDRAVRFDLVDHSFFGFRASCEYATVPRNHEMSE